MSRYRLSVEPLEIVVGWDPPLQTFFLQILDPAKDEEEEIIHWAGKRHGELSTVADLDRALGDHAALTSGVALSPDLRRRLDEEKTNSPQPTEFQQQVIEMFRQVSEAEDGTGTVDLEDEHKADMNRYRLIVEGYSVKITPNAAGEFDVEVWREKEERRPDICASTVDEIRTALQEFDLTLPDRLAEKLSDRQQDYLDNLWRLGAAEEGGWDESPISGMESPDERFPTKEAYEAALERMEREGIARVERENNACTVPPFNTA